MSSFFCRVSVNPRIKKLF